MPVHVTAYNLANQNSCLATLNVAHDSKPGAIEGEEEGFYEILPANTADNLCPSWPSCSNHHEI